MADSVVVSAVVTVAVSVTSAGAALAAQAFASRNSRGESDRALSVTMGEEKKEAIEAFMATAQGVERIIDEWKVAPHTDTYRDTPLSTDGGQAADAVHQMWLAESRLELLCSAEVIETATDYAETANAYVWDDVPEDMRHQDYLGPWKKPFIAAARRDLGLDPRR